MAETEPVKSKRDLVRERLAGKYPDRDFEDEDVFFGQINDDFDDDETQLSGYREREKALSDMFMSDPRSAAFITDWRKGEDPAIGLIRRFGTEIKDVIDDPARQEEIAAANKEYVERVANEKHLEEEYQKNLDASLQSIDALQQKNGLTDDDIDRAMAWLQGIITDGIMGKFAPETIEMAMKAINHDGDVDEAAREGELRGRNSKIEERLRSVRKGDGLAQLDGKNGNSAPRRPSNNIFDLASEAR